jgi:chemotaxis protein CheD
LSSRATQGGEVTLKIVGISEMFISQDPNDVIVTYSLGSCIGVAVYDRFIKAGGMVHCMLPLSKISPDKALKKPCMFADTGVTMLLQEMFNLGATRSNIIVKVAGASSLLDEKGLFKIGERNYTVLRKILWKNNLLISAEDVKGTASRTMTLYMDTGITTIKKGGREEELK